MKNIENKHVLCVNVSCSNELTEKVVDDVGNQLSDKMSDEPGKELSNELSNEQRYDESNEPGNVMYFDESKEPGNVLSYDENNQQFYDESNELIPHEKRKDEKAFPWLQPVECLEEQSEDYPKQNTGNGEKLQPEKDRSLKQNEDGQKLQPGDDRSLNQNEDGQKLQPEDDRSLKQNKDDRSLNYPGYHSQKENVLLDKSSMFAVRIVLMSKHLIKEKREFTISKQVMRSGTSVGAMVSEAVFAESLPDFIHKLAIAQKEIFETIYWVKLLKNSQLLSIKEFESINTDALEILRILTKSIITAKQRKKNERSAQ